MTTRTDDPAAAMPAATTARNWWVFAVLAAAQFLYIADAFIVNVALPTIRDDLNTSGGMIQATVAAYQLAFAATVVVGGRLGDLLGGRRVFLLGLAGFIAASLVCGLAQAGWQLVAARILQGTTAGLMVPQVLVTMFMLFDGAARARAIGIFGIVLGLGGAFGFLMGGLLTTLDLSGLGWRSIFLVNGPIGVVLVLAAWYLMPARPTRAGLRLDGAGAAMLFLATSGLLLPLLFHEAVADPTVLLMTVVVGVIAAVAFIAHIRRLARTGGQPLLPPAMFADRVFRRGTVVLFLVFVGNISFYFVATLYLQQALGLSAMAAGLAMLPLALTFLVGARIGAGRARRLGYRAIMQGVVVELASFALLGGLSQLDGGPAPALLALPLGLFGLGQGLVLAPVMGLVLQLSPPQHAGAANGVLNTVQQTGNAVGVSIIGLIYLQVGPGGNGLLAALGALTLVGLLAIAAMSAGLRRPSGEGKAP